MTQTSAIMIPDASALTIDLSCIDCSEVESQEDKDFLQEKGETILRIVAKAALEVGQQIVEIQEHFHKNDSMGTGLTKFYTSLGIDRGKASVWANKYRSFMAYVELFGTEESVEKFNSLSDVSGARIWTLPDEYRRSFLADIAIGESPSPDLLKEVSGRTEVKLTKTEELLAEAKARKEKSDERWELAKEVGKKEDPTEYNRAQKERGYITSRINEYEKRLLELTDQIEEERAKNAEYERREEKTKSELEKLRFDDDSTRDERIKRLTNSLTISVPQVMADLQKFFTEKDHYPTDVREHLLEQSVYLTNYIADQLDG